MRYLCPVTDAPRLLVVEHLPSPVCQRELNRAPVIILRKNSCRTNPMLLREPITSGAGMPAMTP